MDIGDLTHPPSDMLLQRIPRRKGMSGNAVGLHVADIPLILALGPSSGWLAGDDRQRPVAQELFKSGIQAKVASDPVVSMHHRCWIINQQMPWHAPKVL